MPDEIHPSVPPVPLKECTRCEKFKLLSEFNVVSSARPYPRSVCRECEHEYNRAWKEARKNESSS